MLMMTLSPLAWKWIIIALVLVIGLSLLIRKGLLEAKELELSLGELHLAGWPAELVGLRLLHLSDLHFTAGPDLTARILALTEQARPDLVLISGDLLSPDETGLLEAQTFLTEISRRVPVYFAPGNKDHLEQHALPFSDWAATGATVLRNQAVPFDCQGPRLWIIGVDDPHSERDDLAAALQEVPPGEPALLIAHSPAIIKRPGIERVGAIFAGHTHGGQIRLPGGHPLHIHSAVPLRYGSGTHLVGNGHTILVVSRGAGSTRIPVRLWCPPEMTLWTIKSAAQPSAKLITDKG